MTRKWLCLLMSIVLVFPLLPGLTEGADADGETLEYLYTFVPGPVLEGEGTKTIRELMDALQVCFSRQRADGNDTVRVQLLSEGEEAFSLTAGDTGGEEFALTCSLLGDNKLTLRREQLSSFLLTLVQALGDQGLLRGGNLEKMRALADKAGKIIGSYLDKPPEEAPDTGIDLKPYLEVLTGKATAAEQREIPPEERDESGAAMVASYLVSGEHRKEIINRAMDKIVKLPIIGDQLKGGRIRIGGQEITDAFIRSVFADTPGEVTMDVWLDENGQLVRLLLHTPDISGLVQDPQFAKIQGVEIAIRRTRGEGRNLTSITTFRLPGLEEDLLTMRLERTAGRDIPPMKGDKVHAVGEMDSAELMELIRTMGWTIIWNAANTILTLPECVARILYERIRK